MELEWNLLSASEQADEKMPPGVPGEDAGGTWEGCWGLMACTSPLRVVLGEKGNALRGTESVRAGRSLGPRL